MMLYSIAVAPDASFRKAWNISGHGDHPCGGMQPGSLQYIRAAAGLLLGFAGAQTDTGMAWTSTAQLSISCCERIKHPSRGASGVAAGA